MWKVTIRGLEDFKVSAFVVWRKVPLWHDKWCEGFPFANNFQVSFLLLLSGGLNLAEFCAEEIGIPSETSFFGEVMLGSLVVKDVGG